MPRSSDWKLWLCVLIVPGTIARWLQSRRRAPAARGCRGDHGGIADRDDHAVDGEHARRAARAVAGDRAIGGDEER